MEPLRRVSRQHPCPCCGKPDYCGFNSKIAVCMRVPSDRPTRPDGQIQGYIHVLNDQQRPAYLPPNHEYMRVAPVGARHKWYSALLKELGLPPAYKKALYNRGFDDAFIQRNGYAFLPPPVERQPIVDRLIEQMGTDPGHIPGFYKDEAGKWSLAGSTGLLIPVRDENFLIQACQVRRPNSQVERDEGPRYTWLSSAGDLKLPSGHVIKRIGGTSSGAPAHHQRQPGTPLWLTEGPLKGDFLHYAKRVSTVAVPGVGNWRPLLTDPMTSPNRTPVAIIAFDQDQEPKARENTERHKKELAQALSERGLHVKEAVWDGSKAKGIDDAIRAGLTVEIQPLRLPERSISR